MTTMPIRISLTAALFMPAVLSAQGPVLECDGALTATGGACRATVAGADSMQHQELLLRVTLNGAPLPGTIVRFQATSGTVRPDSTLTDPNGRARALWIRSRGADPVGIAAEAVTTAGAALRYIQLTPRSAPAKRLVIVPWTGIDQSWFEKSPLRGPVDVQIMRLTGSDSTEITDEADCRAQRVAFTRSGAAAGTVSPDTATADIYELGDTGRTGCFVEADWTLGEGPGRKHIHATLVPGSGYRSATRSTEIQATARALPRLIGGIVYAGSRGYVGVKPGSQRTIRVERPLTDGTTLAYDSVVSGPAAIDSVSGAGEAAAFVGVSIPIIPAWHWFAVAAGVDLANPRDDWYAGISMARLIGGVSTEALPVDLHLVGHWGRDPVLQDPDACATGEGCRTENETRYKGIGVLLSIDAGSLFAELIKKLSS